ncbi:MAG: hypothetical protein LAP40_27290 [Acidobacteriia bacterium]|nr:hypothetical protein [Terriglobia bacterium]
MRNSRLVTLVCSGLALTVASSGSPEDGLQAQGSSPRSRPDLAGRWQGRVEALIVDNLQSGTSRTRYYLQTSREAVELEGPVAAGLRPGQRVEIAGQASGKGLLVSQVSAVAADSGAAACSATGEQKAAVILVSFPSKALLSSVTPALMRDSFFGTGRTVDTFLRESSFGQTSMTGDVLGPFVLDADYFDQPLGVRDAALRAAAPSADLTRYNRIFVVAPQGQTGMESGGMALLGCGPIPSPQGTLNASSIWLGAESMIGQNQIADTAAHEMGHGFGLEHARFADYGAEALGPAGQAPAPWDALHEYGDSFSNMGRPYAQWAAPHRSRLGWLAAANIQTVTASGTFTATPYEQAGAGQVLRVGRGTGSGDWLWLEFRQPVGTFDATLPAAAFAGALVHYEDPALTATLSGVDAATYTNLVNFHPTAGFAGDPTLHAGETWNDPYGSLSLTVNSASAAGLSVTVSYAPPSVCPTSAGAAQQFDAAGASGQLTVTAAPGCSWGGVASVPWISVGAGGSGTGNGSLSFTVAPNGNVSPRWGKITVGGTFAVVTQSGAAGGMSISPQTGSFSAAGGNGLIAVATSAPDFAWEMGWDVTWLTDVECSCYQDVGPATIRYIVAKNDGAERTGHITIGGIVFTVTQQGGGVDPSQLTWQPQAPPDAPPARIQMAMAPFGHSGQALLYGGGWDTTVFGDTWLWDGTNWNLLHPANSPGLLSGHAMTYDAARAQIVLFGGVNGQTFLPTNETWVWDGTNWTQMHPAVSPPARYAHAMAYDAVLQKVVLFGGIGGFGDANDTWTWDGANWTQAASPVNPVPRSGHAMTFDATRGQIVLFGGMHNQGGTLTWFSDTWLWDARGWHEAVSATLPAARFGHVLAYHPGLRAVVLVGGYGGKDVTANGGWYYDFHNETWLWNGMTWVQQFPENQPGPTYTLAAAYDETRQALVVHGGDDLTCASRGPKTFFLTGNADPAAPALKPGSGTPGSRHWTRPNR